MDCGPVVPEAVLFDILLLLPVVSLLRFKTVCKSWCSIIESSTFITEQLNRNSKKNNLIVCDDDGKVFMMSDRNHEVCSQMNLEGISLGFDIVGSCNGILCLAYEYLGRCRRLSLWNPATKQVRQLPESSYFSKRNTSLSNNFALGFDIKTNDYKIVSISLDSHGKTLNDALVQVYTLRADSWRTVYEGNDFPIRWVDIFNNAVCRNEMCLWIAGSSTEDTVLVFYFDLTKEVYGTISLPSDGGSCAECSLAFVNDKFAYMERIHRIGYGCYYEIWTMDQFGMKGSWNKLYKLKDTILSRSLANRLLYLSKNGDFILVSKHDNETGHELYLYCIATGEAKKVGVQKALHIEGYIESMVSV